MYFSPSHIELSPPSLYLWITHYYVVEDLNFITLSLLACSIEKVYTSCNSEAMTWRNVDSHNIKCQKNTILENTTLCWTPMIWGVHFVRSYQHQQRTENNQGKYASLDQILFFPERKTQFSFSRRPPENRRKMFLIGTISKLSLSSRSECEHQFFSYTGDHT